MPETLDLFSSQTTPKAIPIKLIRKAPKQTDQLPEGQGDEKAFSPVILDSAPGEVIAMPESTMDEQIAKATAVLKWAMQRYEIAYSFSAGKDSSTTLALAMHAAAELQKEGKPIQRFAILSADTQMENPQILTVMKGELKKLQQWINRHELPGEIVLTTPPLLAQYMVSIIGGKSIISTPLTNSNCSPDLKGKPLTKARIDLFGNNDVANGRFVVNVTGVRFGESERRKANLEHRSESPVDVVMTDADQNVFLAPIAFWDTDSVMEFIGLAVNDLLPFTPYSDLADVWQAYKDAEGECSVGRGDKPTRGCTPRHGCWGCTMVRNDKSMNAMVLDEKHAYMAPLAAFREYLSNTLFDLNRRTWVGRSIVDGYIAFKPDAYAPAELQNLLRYALTIDVEEQEAAKRLGIAPRFQIISLEALIAIDSQWSLQGFARPMTGLKIFRDVYERGQRYAVPKVEEFPKVPIPEARWIHVGAHWDDTAHNDAYTGLRSSLAEIASFDQEPCVGLREIKRNGQRRWVLNASTGDTFSVDAESAAMLLEFELDRLVEKYHGADASTLAPENAFAGQGFKFYVQYGTLTLARSQLSKVDEILRRTAWRERLGLAGYNYDHNAALLLSIGNSEKPKRSKAEIAEEKAAFARQQVAAEERAAKLKWVGRRITLLDLYRDWAPNVPWRYLIRTGELHAPLIPAGNGEAGRIRPTARKNWVLHHLPTLTDVLRCIKQNPRVADRVKAHRCAARKRGYQMDLLKAA